MIHRVMPADTWQVELDPFDGPGALIPVDLAAYDMDGRGAQGIFENTGFPVVVWDYVGNKYLPQYPRSGRESDEMLWGYMICIGIWIKLYPSRDKDLKRVLQFILPNGTLVKVQSSAHCSLVKAHWSCESSLLCWLAV